MQNKFLQIGILLLVSNLTFSQVIIKAGKSGGFNINNTTLTNQSSYLLINSALNEIPKKHVISRSQKKSYYIYNLSGISVKCIDNKVQSIEICRFGSTVYPRNLRFKYPTNGYKGLIYINDEICKLDSIKSRHIWWFDFVETSKYNYNNWNLIFELKDINYHTLIDDYNNWELNWELSPLNWDLHQSISKKLWSNNESTNIPIYYLRRYLINFPNGVISKNVRFSLDSIYLKRLNDFGISDTSPETKFLFSAKYENSPLVDYIDFSKGLVPNFNLCLLGFNQGVNIKIDSTIIINQDIQLPLNVTKKFSIYGHDSLRIPIVNNNPYAIKKNYYMPYYIDYSEQIPITSEPNHYYFLILSEYKIESLDQTKSNYSQYKYKVGQNIGYVEVSLFDFYNNSTSLVHKKKIGLYSGELKD